MVKPTDGLIAAAFVARDWHGGQASGLYALSCGQWQHLTRDDVAAALREFERCEPTDYFCEEAAELDGAIDDLKLWLAANPPEDDEV